MAEDNEPQETTGSPTGSGERVSTLRLVTQDGAALSEEESERRSRRPGGGDTGGGDSGEIPTAYSDDALANVLVGQRLDGNWRYCNDGNWYHWDEQCWRRDIMLGIQQEARAVCRATSSRVETPSLSRSVSSEKTISAVVRLARGAVATPIERFDADPWLFNTPGGIVDLRTGQLLPCDRDKLCMRCGTVAPYGASPAWLQFLDDVTGGDADYKAYLQRLVGYSLAGERREEIFGFIFGPANTGKSKFVETLRMLHGDYGTSAPMSTFEAVHNVERHPTDLAGFVGRRLVTAAETEEGRRWDQQRLTMLTGRDRIPARFMRGDFFEYLPQFLLLFHGNYRPRLSTVDDAMRRRLYLMPFTHVPVMIDRSLIDKFRAELAGIMAWAVEGCVLWQAHGLRPPRIVTHATDEYFELEDLLSQWLEERAELGFAFFAATRDMHQDFTRWMQGRGFVPPEAVFAGRLERIAGVARKAKLPNGRRGFVGIRLKGAQEEFGL